MNKNQISDIMLERYNLNELDNEKMNEIRELCEKNPDLASRVMEIKKSDEDILKTYSEDKIAAEVTHRFETRTGILMKKKRSPVKYFRIFAPLAVAAVAVVFVLLPVIKRDVTIIDQIEITREKGKDSSIYLYRKSRNGEVELVAGGSRAKAGDLLQIGYSSLRNPYGVILSIDGRGKVTLHYPASEKASAKLATGKSQLLGNSFELDDAPLFERFFFITSPDEINVESVVFSAEMLAVERTKAMTDDLSFNALNNKSLNQVSILIKKD